VKNALGRESDCLESREREKSCSMACQMVVSKSIFCTARAGIHLLAVFLLCGLTHLAGAYEPVSPRWACPESGGGGRRWCRSRVRRRRERGRGDSEGEMMTWQSLSWSICLRPGLVSVGFGTLHGITSNQRTGAFRLYLVKNVQTWTN
jgi:hypothetical protein